MKETKITILYLGLIGFQILINEAAESSSSKCCKYVDDLTFADYSTCAHYPSSSLQADLEDFTKWSKDNMLKLNPSKCQALQVYFGKNPPESSLVTYESVRSHCRMLMKLRF